MANTVRHLANNFKQIMNKGGKDSVNQRLNLIVASFEKGTKSAFAAKIGISVQGVHDLLSGRKGSPSFKVLSSILENYPTVDANWLVLGQGQMLKDFSSASDLSEDEQTVTSELIIAREMVKVTAATLSKQKQMLELLGSESLRLTAQKAEIAERQAAGTPKADDAALYQQLNTQWLRLLDEEERLRTGIEFGTTLLAEQQAEYIEQLNRKLGIEPTEESSE